MHTCTIVDVTGLSYRTLNALLRHLVQKGVREVILKNVLGHRFIGAGLKAEGITIHVEGTPGNDLGAFMDGPTLLVYGNAQDCVANTMDAGEIVIYGDAGDLLGYSMRGGRVFVMGDVGYRVGIHMKAWGSQMPVIVIGGKAYDFLGEYMAGGTIIILGLKGETLRGSFIGTGMHGGTIYIRGEVNKRALAKEVEVMPLKDEDVSLLKKHIYDFCQYFSFDFQKIMKSEFTKLRPKDIRPYARLYSY